MDGVEDLLRVGWRGYGWPLMALPVKVECLATQLGAYLSVMLQRPDGGFCCSAGDAAERAFLPGGWVSAI
jgi:hypothetical protein